MFTWISTRSLSITVETQERLKAESKCVSAYVPIDFYPIFEHYCQNQGAGRPPDGKREMRKNKNIQQAGFPDGHPL